MSAGGDGAGPDPAGRPEHVFTVDLEEYFHVHAFDGRVERGDWDRYPSRVDEATDVLIDLLERQGCTATFFVLGWVASRHPDVVRRIARAGHEVASHGWSHRRISDLQAGDFRRELRRSKETLEGIVGEEVVGYRAPSFSLVPGTEWALTVLAEEGFRYDSSIYPVRRPGAYGYPGAPGEPFEVETGAGRVTELPVATADWLGLSIPAGGGAYFRHFPYPVIRWAFRQKQDRGSRGVFYIHSWEVDSDQPRVPVPWWTRLRHYRNLDRTVPKLGRLMDDFRFGSASRALRGAGRGSSREPSIQTRELSGDA